MSGGRNYTQVSLMCPSCGNIATIWRRSSKLKEKGHVKDLWCVRCMETTKHVEVRDVFTAAGKEPSWTR